MPTSTKQREKSITYHTHNSYDSRAYSGRRVYSYTSTAYDYPPLYPDRTAPSREDSVSKRQQPSKSAHKKNHAQAGILRVCSIAVMIFILCFTVIYRYSVILESNQEIKALEKEYDIILSDNQMMQAKIDRYLEMGEVEKVAREELGMMKPESYQIFYIDMKMDDVGGAGLTATSDQGRAIAGTPGALVNAFRIYNSYSR